MEKIRAFYRRKCAEQCDRHTLKHLNHRTENIAMTACMMSPAFVVGSFVRLPRPVNALCVAAMLGMGGAWYLSAEIAHQKAVQREKKTWQEVKEWNK